MFTHVAARMTCWPPTRPFQAVLQSIRYLLDRSLCFRLERELRRVGLQVRPKPYPSPTDQPCLSKAHTTMPPSGRCAASACRKNYLFMGSDAGGERAAAIYSLVETAKLNGVDPEA